MAASITFVIFLFLLLRTSVSMPISLDEKTVKSQSDNASIIEETVVPLTDTILGLKEETEIVQTVQAESVLNVFESVEGAKRIKRDVARSGAFCPGDLIRFGSLCVPPESDENNEVSDDYQDGR
ncbi:hypothetical protein PYW08_004674 [Mythimna loreyi]|uniref:Uncharacterized protein n=1 Tax=Mythimna loreyi TaxID=667449 RepID=A0ACC2QRJ1_9NEOP|nr:hypothetical protein PYW08_004674 [Mythimna loreyi]